MREGGRLAALALVVLALAACDRASDVTAIAGGDPHRGRDAVRRYGCGTCHTIPGVSGARGTVGPPLAQMGRRSYVAGHLQNTPENLARWIRQPQEVDRPNAMPDMGVTETDSRDIAAFLYTLR
jgi:cytochrome c1